MVQKDYILRMIEQMAAIVAALRRAILKGDLSSWEAESRGLATAAGLDLSLARVLEPEALLSLLSPDGRADPTRVWLAAELLYLEALSYQTEGDTEKANGMFAKAWVLYSSIPENQRGVVKPPPERSG